MLIVGGSNPGIVGRDPNSPSPKTPGSTGLNDFADPNARNRRLGNTQGALGINDLATPTSEIATEAGALDLEYEVVARSLTTETTAYKTVVSVGNNATLGRHGTSYFVHGNNRIHIKNASRGTDVFKMYRVFRVWSAPLDPSTHNRTGPYSTGAEKNWFINDGTGGTLWIDVPGQQIPMSANARQKERHLTEFLVGIEGRPNVGGLYFIVIVDETPSEYQVSMYEARRYSGEVWQNEIFPKGFKFWGDSDNASVERLSKTEPDTDETTANFVSNYGGWQKFPQSR